MSDTGAVMGEDLTALVANGLAEAMRDHDGSIPIKWLVITTCIEADGRETIAIGHAPGMMNFEVLGMATYVQYMVQAGLTRVAMTTEEGDSE